MSQSSLRGGFGPLSVMQRDPRLASRYRFADALSQQGASTAPVSSPLEGLARALQGGLGGYFAGQAETEAQDRSSAASRLMGDALAKFGTDPDGALRMLGENPDTADVASQIGLARALQKPADDTFTLAPGQRRVRADGTVIAEAPAQAPTPTGNVAAYQFAQQQGYGGSFMDFTRELAAAGRAPAAPEPLVEIADPQSPTGRRLVTRTQGMGQPAPGTGQGAGPFSGSALDAQSLNIVLDPNQDPNSPTFAAAFNHLYGPKQIAQPDGTVITVTPSPPSGVRQPGRPMAPPAAPPASIDAITGGATAAPEAAQAAPAAPPGMTATTTQVPGAEITRVAPPSPQAREAARMLDVEAGRVTDAVANFRQALTDNGGGSSLAVAFNNPRDPKARRVIQAYNNLITALRSPAFLNTGVLQPGEVSMIDNMLLNPQSTRGVFANMDTYNAGLGEIERFVQQGLERARVSAGQAPGAAPQQAPPTRVIEFDAQGNRVTR
jgi:hypothetical protein